MWPLFEGGVFLILLCYVVLNQGGGGGGALTGEALNCV